MNLGIWGKTKPVQEKKNKHRLSIQGESSMSTINYQRE